MHRASCIEFGVERPTAALRIAASHPVVRTAVVNAASPEQTSQKAASMSGAVPPEPGYLLIRQRASGPVAHGGGRRRTSLRAPSPVGAEGGCPFLAGPAARPTECDVQLGAVPRGLADVGVQRAILIQADDAAADTRAMPENAATQDFIAGVLRWLPLGDPAAAANRL